MAQKPDIRPWVYKAEEDDRAALVHHRKGFPKTHDLVELLKFALVVDPLLETIRPNVRELLPYAVAFRYPGEKATREESQRAVLAMKNMREFSAKGWAYLDQCSLD